MFKAHGIAHTTLTVSNVTETKNFYEELFQAKLDMDDEKSFSLMEVGIPCWFVQWGQPNSGRFNERRVGLDHIAFKLETLDELEEIIKRLNDMNIANEGLQRFAGKYPYVAFRDRDNIQTEFFIPKEL